MSSASPLRYAARRVRRGWRARGATLLVAALVVAVGAAGAVGLFAERVRTALVASSGDALGADAVLRSRNAIDEALLERARTEGLQTALTATMTSVVFGSEGDGETSALASVKGVSDDYPLRSRLRVADEPFGAPRDTGPPARGTAYVDNRLHAELELDADSTVHVGALELRVAAVLTFEPDRGGGFGDLAPRLMLHYDDLLEAGLLGPGARVQHTVQLRGPPAGLETMRAAAPQGVTYVTPREARQELAGALDRASVFLDLAVVCALVLAAAAAMIAADSFGRGLRDEAALLRTLGASQRFIGSSLLWLLVLLGGTGVAAGSGVAWLSQEVIARTAGQLLDARLPPPSPAPLLRAAALGTLLLFGFAAPAVLSVRRTSPMRIFQRGDEGSPLTGWSVRGAAIAALVALIAMQARSLALTLVVVIGALVLAAVLYLAARLLLRLLDGLRTSGAAGAAWRLGLANLARRRRSAGGLAAALGLVLLALMLLAVVRNEMLTQWRDSLPPGTPNVFLINVQTEQRAELRAFLADAGHDDVTLWPMARGRLVALNGEAVRAEDFDDPETERWINRDFNLSWAAELPDDNTLISGRWWSDGETDQPLLSADEYAVERLDLSLGDTLTLRFADRDVQLTVHNTRRVQWDSFRPNFFLLAAPGAMENAGVPVSWLTSFHSGEHPGPLLRRLALAFPNVTAIDIDALLAQVRGIIDRVVQSVAFLFVFALAAGLLVLLAAIESSRGEREREVALLRTLGARRRFIAGALLVEYGALGAAAGLLCAVAAQIVAGQIAARVFEIPFTPPLWPWLAGPAGGALLVGLMGWFALSGITRVPPDRVLRQAEA